MKMLKNKHYLDRDDLEEMKKRQEHINQHLLIIEALTLVKNAWLAQKSKKYGLDPTKEYTVNAKSGQINEIKKDEQNKH